jgi:hypothetical protein
MPQPLSKNREEKEGKRRMEGRMVKTREERKRVEKK